jgi:hypothetical protein
MRREIRLFMVFKAATFAVAALIHFGLLAHEFGVARACSDA